MAPNDLEKTGRCRIRVNIRARGREMGGYVVQMVEDGIELMTDQVEGIWTGDHVEIVGNGFGPVVGTARWRVPRRLGVKLRDASETETSLRELWRFSGNGKPAAR